MALPRAYIPWRVRLQVAQRQLIAAGGDVAHFHLQGAQRSTLAILRHLGFEKPHLDHDPALELREFDERRGEYTPDELDPAWLVYRESAKGKNDHGRKTYGRAPDAERTVTTKGSDAWLAKKFRRLEGKTKKSRRPKQKIPQRKNPWGNQKRGFRR